jgi:hypothetical protein
VEIILLIVMLVVQITLLLLGCRYPKTMLFFLFAAITGLVTILSVIQSSNNITYVSSDASVVINAGAFFLLIPILLTILCFVGMIQSR